MSQEDNNEPVYGVDFICICLDCGTPMSAQKAEKSPWSFTGDHLGVCGACGGPVKGMAVSQVEATMERRRNGFPVL